MSVAPVMNPSEAAGENSDRNKRMDVKNRNQMEYLTERTLIRDFIPYPRFLLDTNLTQTARILYALLLDRSKISRNNGWKNEKGYIYVIYPIMDLAQVLVKSHMTIKKALNELENAGLLERQKQGFSKPNLLYVRIPAEGKKSVPVKERKLSPIGKEKDTYEGKKTVPVRDRKVSPNKMSNSQMIYSQINKEREARSAYGQEIRELDRLMEELSSYMRSSGKQYADYAVTLRRWAEWSAPVKNILDYTCSEEDSL